MTSKRNILLLGLLLGVLCLGVVAARNPHLRDVLAQRSSTEVEEDHAYLHEDDDQGHAHPDSDEDDDPAHPQEGDPQAPAAPDEHDHEPGVVHLDEQRIAELGIELAAVGSGLVTGSVNLPGEIKLDTDRVAHIVPQVSGIARRVLKTVGDRVERGEVIAWLESAKLGETKVQYLAKLAEISCCSMELTRAQQVHDNTMQLLTALEASPSLEILRDTGGAPMGKNLSQLVSAYAEWVLTQKTYDREKGLYDKQITSQGEFLKAENALKKAEAIYNATRDSVAYDVQHTLLEAQRIQRVRQIELTSAERSLYVLGLAADDMHRLEKMEQQDDPTGDCDDPNCPQCRQQAREELAAASNKTDHVCSDPNCQDCAKHVHAETVAESGEAGCACSDPNCRECAGEVQNAVVVEPPETGGYEQRLAWYPVRAPFAGTVISKHLSTGEYVKDDSELFVIANLDTVWVDFQVHQKDLPSVREGQTMEMQIGSGLGTATGKITYVSPIVDVATRTAWARVVLPNAGGRFRPGLFVTGTAAVNETQAPIAVSESAVQYIEDKPCVFVYGDEHFEKRNVALGRADGNRIEIVLGLNQGETVAVKGSFHIKAEIERQSTGGGGHGHVH